MPIDCNEPSLPDQVDYDDLIATLTHLLPGLDPSQAMWVRITPTEVLAEWWDGRNPRIRRMPVVHMQGSATEGGQATPTTPPPPSKAKRGQSQ